MPYCTSCGAEVRAEDEFCTSCGERVGSVGSGGDEEVGVGEPASRTDDESGDVEGTGVEEQATAIAEDAEVHDEETAEATPSRAATRGRQLAAGGAVVTAVGAFLPWLTVSFLTASKTYAGIDSAGILTLGLAIVAGVALVVGKGKPWSRKSRVFVCLTGLAVALVAVAYIADPWAMLEDPPRGLPRSAYDLEVGLGLYASALGGGLVALGPLYGSAGRS